MALDDALSTLPEGEEYQIWYDVVEDHFSAPTYEGSVFDATGDDGLLSPGDARRLLSQHSVTWEGYVEEQPDGNRHPAYLLSFLGY